MKMIFQWIIIIYKNEKLKKIIKKFNKKNKKKKKIKEIIYEYI